MVIVENIKKSVHDFKDVPAKYKSLLPKLRQVKYSFDLLGVSNAVANALRRCLCGELPSACLHAESMKTNNRRIIHEQVLARISLIPVEQSVSSSAKFELDVRNDDLVLRDVKSGEFKHSGKKLPFDENITLFTLDPGQSASMTCTIRRANGKINAGHAMTHHCASIARDPSTYANSYKSHEGTAASIADVREWTIKFETKGTIDPEALIVAACDLCIKRLDATLAIQSSGNEHIVSIPSETDTIGNLFMRAATDLYPDINAFTYRIDELENHTLTMRVTYDDIDALFDSMKLYIKEQFVAIKKYFI